MALAGLRSYAKDEYCVSKATSTTSCPPRDRLHQNLGITEGGEPARALYSTRVQHNVLWLSQPNFDITVSNMEQVTPATGMYRQPRWSETEECHATDARCHGKLDGKVSFGRHRRHGLKVLKACHVHLTVLWETGVGKSW